MEERTMSSSNGDKSRFGRLRRQKILLRKQMRELRGAMKEKTTVTATPESKPEGN